VSQRTSLFNQLPWVGGVNTSLDESMIPPNQLTRADSVVFDTRGSKKKRDGINYDFDSVANASKSIYGLHEFWYGTNSKTRKFVSINEDGLVRSYSTAGTASTVTVNGKAWSGVIDQITMVTFNNKLIIALNGDTNLVKFWDGDNNLEDLQNVYNQTLYTNGRSSSGTTRTLVLSSAFKGLVGDYIVISGTTGGNASFYNGTYAVTSISTSNVTDDTITYTAVGTLAEAGTSDSALRVNGTAPQATAIREHLGRLWTNDKTNRDRLHYSSPFNHTEWLGFGDSGALDIGVGDGDPDGIVAIFPSFKGDLFVAKRTKLYRVRGTSPENFSIELVSSGIGCVSHNAVTLVDQDDLMFISEKGVHSINAVSAYGDFNSTFTSADIQKTFIDSFPKSRLKYAKAAYNPEINSVAFAFTDSNTPDLNVASLDINNSIWLYNVIFKSWYRWNDIPSQAMIVANDADKKRFYFGTDMDRIAKSFSGNPYDVDYDGNQTEITMTLHTGQIIVDGSLFNVKGFKRFLLYYKPFSTHTINVDVYVDGQNLDSANQLVFNDSPLGDLIGETFILGESMLGGNLKLASYTRTIDGYGRSVKIELTMGGINETAEIQGFGIEFEVAGTSPEVRN